MKLFFPRETKEDERRVSITPDFTASLVALGAEVVVESKLGTSCRYTDEQYREQGAIVVDNRHEALAEADMVLRLGKPPIEEIGRLKEGCIHVSFLDPFNEPVLVSEFASKKVSAVSMEMLPRTTRAQKMDALSSQANIAGYAAVIVAAERLDSVLPMMMTPAGTLKPARVFVIGAGVAGLQAIATAKRLGARVDAFDTRPVVEEQVKSLGAKFVKVDLGDTGETKDGYAKELTEEQQTKQREAMAKVCEQSDIVITTAKLFGRKAPIIITKEMVERMKPGSVIVDLAIESGGNVEGAVLGEEVEVNGVRVVGLPCLEGHVAVHASQMYASNLFNFVDEFWDKDEKTLPLKLDDEIIAGALVTHGGQIVNRMLLDARGKGASAS